MSQETNSVEEQPRIRLLDPSVVNKIAAGEIIIAPSNALKEMLENSIDAQSTSIDIVAKEGGLKLLQITDDGIGIAKGDLPLLCERFTTSKLSKFEDLNSIATYGFRGEALASISHISHLSVVTKTKTDECAWKCYYKEGKLVAPKPNTTSDPKPTAGRNGTQIVVEDLFYNVPSRLRALRSGNDEYNKIADVVGRYAIHTLSSGFSCKKFGNGFSDINVRASMNCKDRIRQVFGSSVANDLVEISISPNEEYGLLGCSGQITNSNFNNKKVIAPVFFINNRLVSCDPLRRAIGQVYTTFLPKGYKPFIYMALQIDPANLDVNVHPTKREVRFLHEDEIIDHIVLQVQSTLSGLDSSRTFMAQKVFMSNKRTREEDMDSENELNSKDVFIDNASFGKPVPRTFEAPAKKRTVSGIPDLNRFKEKKQYEKTMVRTDFSQSKLTSFLTSAGSSSSTRRKIDLSIAELEEDNGDDENIDESIVTEIASGEEDNNVVDDTSVMETGRRVRVTVQLKSITALCEEVESRVNKHLTEVFSKHSYVGVVDYSRRLMCFQYDVRLYLVDYASLCTELFYQIGLSDFSNFGYINFDSPVSIRRQLEKVYQIESFMQSFKGPVPTIDSIIESFIEMSEMFEEYFSITITVPEEQEDPEVHDAYINSLPMLVKGYVPPLNKLPLFLFKIGSRIDFTDEKACLGGILRQLALFYVPESISDEDEDYNDDAGDDSDGKSERKDELAKTLENVISPLIKRRLLATNTLVRDVIEIASLPGLYKVFERC